MADGVYAAMYLVKPTARQSVLDRARSHPEREHLGPRDGPVLPPGELRDRHIAARRHFGRYVSPK